MRDLRRGQCLCGAIRVQAEIDSDNINACHCGQCRRWTGGSPYLAVHVSDVEFDGTPASYRASDWGARLFCAACGTTISWKMQGKPYTNLAVGLFDDQGGLTLGSEIFVDRRAPWQDPIKGASQSTEADEYAKLATEVLAGQALQP